MWLLPEALRIFHSFSIFSAVSGLFLIAGHALESSAQSSSTRWVVKLTLLLLLDDVASSAMYGFTLALSI